MTDPLRSDPAAAAGELSERDRDARIEELLLTGLDHYFQGRHDLAINIWTRVLFLDRGHARARAYIERARSAVSERQREGDELIHSAEAALDRGDAGNARIMVTAALERGAAAEEAFALLDRLQRIEAAGAPQAAHERATRARPGPEIGRRPPPRAGAGRARLVWIAAGTLLGMVLAVVVMLWFGVGPWGAAPVAGDPGAPSRASEPPLPVPRPAEIALTRARALYEKGRLRDALPALDEIRHGDPLRPQADDLRAAIQRRLLESRSREPGAAPRGAQ